MTVCGGSGASICPQEEDGAQTVQARGQESQLWPGGFSTGLAGSKLPAHWGASTCTPHNCTTCWNRLSLQTLGLSGCCRLDPRG